MPRVRGTAPPRPDSDQPDLEAAYLIALLIDLAALAAGAAAEGPASGWAAARGAAAGASSVYPAGIGPRRQRRSFVPGGRFTPVRG